MRPLSNANRLRPAAAFAVAVQTGSASRGPFTGAGSVRHRLRRCARDGPQQGDEANATDRRRAVHHGRCLPASASAKVKGLTYSEAYQATSDYADDLIPPVRPGITTHWVPSCRPARGCPESDADLRNATKRARSGPRLSGNAERPSIACCTSASRYRSALRAPARQANPEGHRTLGMLIDAAAAGYATPVGDRGRAVGIRGVVNVAVPEKLPFLRGKAGLGPGAGEVYPVRDDRGRAEKFVGQRPASLGSVESDVSAGTVR